MKGETCPFCGMNLDKRKKGEKCPKCGATESEMAELGLKCRKKTT